MPYIFKHIEEQKAWMMMMERVLPVTKNIIEAERLCDDYLKALNDRIPSIVADPPRLTPKGH